MNGWISRLQNFAIFSLPHLNPQAWVPSFQALQYLIMIIMLKYATFYPRSNHYLAQRLSTLPLSSPLTGAWYWLGRQYFLCSRTQLLPFDIDPWLYFFINISSSCSWVAVDTSPLLRFHQTDLYSVAKSSLSILALRLLWHYLLPLHTSLW